MQHVWYPVSAKLVQRKSNRDLQQFLDTEMEDEDEEDEENEGEDEQTCNCRGFGRKFPNHSSELVFRRVVGADKREVRYSVHRGSAEPLDSWEIPMSLVVNDLDLLPSQLDEHPVPISLRELLVCQIGLSKLRQWWIPEVSKESKKQA